MATYKFILYFKLLQNHQIIRRQKCFELSKELGCSSIELALAYVLNKHSNIFPLVGPRTLFESESCMQATNIKLSENQMNWLIS